MKKLIFILLLIPALTFGQMVQESITYLGVTTQKFSPKIPGDYPSILWLHGLDGTWYSDNGGVGQEMKNGVEKSFIVYCPQNPDQKDWSSNEIKAIKALIESGSHPKNIVCGHSQGGMGTCSAINLFPDFWFAAGICSGKTSSTAYKKFIKIHIRAWQGADDKLMGNSIYRFIDSVAANGGDATYIKYPSPNGHNISDKAFDLYDPQSFWKWLENVLQTTPSLFRSTDKIIRSEILNGVKIKFTTESGRVYYQSLN